MGLILLVSIYIFTFTRPFVKLKRLFFSHWMILSHLPKIIWPYMWGFISGFSNCVPLIYMTVFMPVPHCFYYCNIFTFNVIIIFPDPYSNLSCVNPQLGLLCFTYFFSLNFNSGLSAFFTSLLAAPLKLLLLRLLKISKISNPVDAFVFLSWWLWPSFFFF